VVSTPVFGQGWNLGAVFGVNLPIQKNLVVSLSSGFTYQGPFYRPSLILGGTDRVRPGDDYTVTANVRYKTGPWRLSGSLSYIVETQSTIDDVAFSKSGDRVTATGAVGYFWNDDWFSKLTTTFTHQQRNLIAVVGSPALAIEPADANSNVEIVTFSTSYSHGPWTVGPTTTFMHRHHNSYDPFTLSFLPEKTKFSLGATASYDVTKKIALNGRIEHMWLNEDSNPGPIIGPVPGFRSDAWVFVFGGSATF
jgi:hypothetical protein